MATTSQKQAIESVKRLPAADQEHVAKQLTLYAQLKRDIAEGREVMDCNRVTEISSVEGFVDNLFKKEHWQAQTARDNRHREAVSPWHLRAHRCRQSDKSLESTSAY